jgi:hypothetical protein
LISTKPTGPHHRKIKLANVALDLVHQEIWAYLLTHHAISALISRAATAADIDPDRISFAKALNIVRR